jgi:hypothetical protein
MFKKSVFVFVWFLVVFLFCFGVYGGLQMTRTLWPGLHDDGAMYSTIVINRAGGFGNEFNVYTPALLRKNGRTEITSHGQLYYPIAASFLGRADFASFLRWIHRSNLVAYFLAFVVFLLAWRRIAGGGWLPAALFGLAGAYGTTAVLHYLQGRPGHGVPFVLLIFALAKELMGGKPLSDFAAGIQTGLIAAISPLPGAICGLGTVFARMLPAGCANPLLAAMTQAFVALITCLSSTYLVYDRPLWEWLRNTIQSGAIFFPNPDQFGLFWWEISLAPGVGVIFALTLIFGLYTLFLLMRRKGHWQAQIVAILCGICLLGIFWKHGILWPGGNYCFLPFFPMVCLWCAQQGWGLFCARLPQAKFACTVALLCMTALPGLGYLRTCLFQDSILQTGTSFQEALSRVNELKSSLGENEVILIDGYRNARNAVVFDAPPWKFRTFCDDWLDAEKKLNYSAKYFLSLQFSDANPIPPDSGKFLLLENKFNNTPVYIFGLKVKNSTPGYGYAIFERVTTSPAD